MHILNANPVFTNWLERCDKSPRKRFTHYLLFTHYFNVCYSLIPLGPVCWGWSIHGLRIPDDQIGIRGIWRADQSCGFFVVFLKPFPSRFCGVIGYIVLLWEGALPSGCAIATAGCTWSTMVFWCQKASKWMSGPKVFQQVIALWWDDECYSHHR